MLIAADMHVHIYPCYNAGLALRSASNQLRQLADEAVLAGRLPADEEVLSVLFLSERHDCSFFADLHAGHWKPEQSGFELSEVDDRHCILNDITGAGRLLPVAGRQIVSSEKLELTALGTDMRVADRSLSCKNLLRDIRSAGALPVLNWSPGKWTFRRRALVKGLMQSERPGSLLFADTALRPDCLWPEPLLKAASRAGFGVLCGSDPFPFAGEEGRIGRYALGWQLEIQGRSIFEGVMNCISHSDFSAVKCGTRLSPVGVLKLLCRLRFCTHGRS